MKKVLPLFRPGGLSALLLLARSPGGVEELTPGLRLLRSQATCRGRYQWLDFFGRFGGAVCSEQSLRHLCVHTGQGSGQVAKFQPGTRLLEGDTPKWSELHRSSSSRHDYRGVRAFTFKTEGVVYGVASGDGGGGSHQRPDLVSPEHRAS